jgi:hypothetical protein
LYVCVAGLLSITVLVGDTSLAAAERACSAVGAAIGSVGNVTELP